MKKKLKEILELRLNLLDGIIYNTEDFTSKRIKIISKIQKQIKALRIIIEMLD